LVPAFWIYGKQHRCCHTFASLHCWRRRRSISRLGIMRNMTPRTRTPYPSLALALAALAALRTRVRAQNIRPRCRPVPLLNEVLERPVGLRCRTPTHADLERYVPLSLPKPTAPCLWLWLRKSSTLGGIAGGVSLRHPETSPPVAAERPARSPRAQRPASSPPSRRTGESAPPRPRGCCFRAPAMVLAPNATLSHRLSPFPQSRRLAGGRRVLAAFVSSMYKVKERSCIARWNIQSAISRIHMKPVGQSENTHNKWHRHSFESSKL